MKRLDYLLILIIIFSLSCGCTKEDEEKNYNEISEDIVFTDSFSPHDWERPISRRHVKSGDNQIGAFINDDVIDPKLRAIIKTVTDLIKTNKSTDKDTLANILSPAAYNSFILRNADLIIKENYTLRIQMPANVQLKTFWLKFKIMFKHTSFIGDIELTFNDKDKCVISDFDNELFNQLKSYFTAKK